MKAVVWVLFALLALLWTLGVWAGAALLQVGAQWLGSAPQLDAAGAMATLGVPAWITLWVDVAVLQAVLESVRLGLETLQQGGPMLATLLQWLVPLAWIAWGAGMLALLLLAVVAHLLVSRLGRSGGGTPPPQAGLGGASAV